jgi:hypothetical protein
MSHIYRKEFSMHIRYKLIIPLLMLLASILAACRSGPKFVAPEIEPPTDLIPAYLPKGYKLKSGFQIAAETTFPAPSNGDEGALFGRLRESNLFFDLKSPTGNDIQGVYYQGKDYLILIAKSYFPGGTLDLWRADYDASNLEFGECECAGVRLAPTLFRTRFYEIQEERTIGETQVAILKGPIGWIAVFVRGDYLLTVESGISLEENLKIAASLLEK